VIEIYIMYKSPSDVLDIVRELRQLGLVQGRDFDFAYKPPQWDNFSGDEVYNKHTVFSFYTEELASWFALKYVDEISQ
jgi:hypothetical protein